MNIVPISIQNHHDWSYVGLSNYNHTFKDSIVPILIAEIGKIAVTNPIVFLEKDKSLGLYSLQSILPEMNLMIDRKGSWINSYIPARYRSLPFVLANNSDDKSKNEKILCFIDDLKCVAKSFDRKSTRIFDDNNQLSADMQRVFEFLKSIEQNEFITQKALQSIQKMDILEDWQLSIKLSDGEKKMNGLKKINVEKLKGLTQENLYELNQTGGLDISFASIFSLNNIENLRSLIINKTKFSEENKTTKSIRDVTIEKQKKEKKVEMDNLVKNLLLDDEI